MQPPVQPISPLTTLLAGAVTLLLLAGCGGAKDDTAASTSPAAANVSAAAPSIVSPAVPATPTTGSAPVADTNSDTTTDTTTDTGVVSTPAGSGEAVVTTPAVPAAPAAATASNRMGAVYSASGTRFSLWSPDSADVSVTVGTTRYRMTAVPDADGYSGVYAVTVPGDQKLQPYTFAVNGSAVTDPYAAMVQTGSRTGIVIDPADTALGTVWATRPALVNREDALIYEVHVRDFTIDGSAGVATGQRGTYPGMVQSGTTVNGVTGGSSSGIDHLVDLGVTHVQLMPVADSAACSQTTTSCYSWGYDPVNYNVPEERYSATPDDPAARIREFKTMVDGFHQRGIRVVLDVVYNHTQSKDVFSGITSRYYNAVDLTGLGNTLDTRQPMVARMIRDSLEYWVREYNVDGFRFDLMGAFDYSTVTDWGTYLETQFPGRNLLLYGEPWVASDSADSNVSQRVRYGTAAAMAAAHVGVFNGTFRDVMKGNVDDGAGGGFIFNSGSGSDVGNALLASPRAGADSAPLADLWARSFTSDPEQSINYVDVHDNLCLADKVTAWAALNGQTANTGYRQRLQQFALSMVLTAQGMPLLHGGSEMLRTKQGDKNSYASPDAINAFNWNWRNDNAASFDYVKKLVKLRSSHPALRLTSWQAVRERAQTTVLDNSLVTVLLDGAAAGDSWSKILIVANAGANRTLALPAGNWSVHLEQSSASAGNERVVSGSFTAEGTAVSVLHQ